MTVQKIVNEMMTQDNRATSHPVFYVQQLDSELFNKEGEKVSRWLTIEAFFTNAGANQFVDDHHYDYGTLRVYVGSGYNNVEWQAAREFMAESLGQELPR